MTCDLQREDVLLLYVETNADKWKLKVIRFVKFSISSKDSLEIFKESFELIENLTIYVHLRCFKQNLNKENLLNLEPFGWLREKAERLVRNRMGNMRK